MQCRFNFDSLFLFCLLIPIKIGAAAGGTVKSNLSFSLYPIDNSYNSWKLLDMAAALTSYWQDFIDQMIKSGRYNNRSEVIRAGLRSLEEQELAKNVRQFDQIFTGGRSGNPDGKTIQRIVARQKSRRKARQ
jgi:antitoxin ParD1/3/4